MTLMRAAGVLISATIVLGACSSRSDSHAQRSSSAPTTRSTVTEATFKAQVEKLCSDSNDEIGAAAAKMFGRQAPGADQWRTFMLSTVLPLIGKRVSAIDDAAEPAADTAKVQAIVDAGNAAIASARRDPTQLSPSSRAPFDHFDDLVTAAGLGRCAVGG